CWPATTGNCATCVAEPGPATQPVSAMSRRIPVLLAWSGGKDAAWTLHVLRQSATHAVVGLLSTVAEGRSTMQGVRVEVLHAQAAAAGLPLLEVAQPASCDNATWERTMATALEAARLRWPGLRTAAFGDLLLEDVRAWRRQRLDSIGWDLITPLFRFDTAMLARRMIEAGLQARLCCVDPTRLDPALAGRSFDMELLQALPAEVDPCGEHGEFHTCVWAGPMFQAPLELRPGATTIDAQGFARTDFSLAG